MAANNAPHGYLNLFDLFDLIWGEGGEGDKHFCGTLTTEKYLLYS